MWTASSNPEPKARRAAELPIRVPVNITPERAIELQQRLAPLVNSTTRLPRCISAIVGCDATYFDARTLATAVSVNYGDLSVRRARTVSEQTSFPYIPGLFGFREAPPVLRAVRLLREASCVCMVDGHGIAHPRKFGLACLVGLALNRPTIGVAKSLLYGSVKGRRVLGPYGRTIARVLNLPGSGKTIYVSVGHKISLTDAVAVVKRCLTPQGPLPIRLAHQEVTKTKWQVKKSSQVSS